MKIIKVNSKRYGIKDVIVDDEDYKELINYKWIVNQGGNTYYALISGTSVRMHWFIKGKPNKNECIDHINGNGLDNRKENLRIVDYTINAGNRHYACKKTNKVTKMGVFYRERKRLGSGRYVARVEHHGKTIYIGSYINEETAHEAYMEKKIELGHII